MITYDPEWDKLDLYINTEGIGYGYCYYLDLIGQYQEGMTESLYALSVQAPQYFRFVEIIVYRFKLLTASIRLINAVEEFINKPQFVDFELYIPELRDRIKHIEECEERINGLLSPNNITLVMKCRSTNGLEFSVFEPADLTNVLWLFVEGNFIQKIMQMFSNIDLALPEVKDYSTAFISTVALIIKKFKAEIPYWPCWLIDTGDKEICMLPQK